ncbi:MAG: hypothetical protein QOI73_1778, partial [Solirubrobacteraceae bacterium]|nr:hypothetical protein [Solirubrobacteraceae bacterium]
MALRHRAAVAIYHSPLHSPHRSLHPRHAIAGACAVALGLSVCAGAHASSTAPDGSRLVVRFKRDVAAAERTATLRAAG